MSEVVPPHALQICRSHEECDVMYYCDTIYNICQPCSSWCTHKRRLTALCQNQCKGYYQQTTPSIVQFSTTTPIISITTLASTNIKSALVPTLGSSSVWATSIQLTVLMMVLGCVMLMVACGLWRKFCDRNKQHDDDVIKKVEEGQVLIEDEKALIQAVCAQENDQGNLACGNPLLGNPIRADDPGNSHWQLSVLPLKPIQMAALPMPNAAVPIPNAAVPIPVVPDDGLMTGGQIPTIAS